MKRDPARRRGRDSRRTVQRDEAMRIALVISVLWSFFIGRHAAAQAVPALAAGSRVHVTIRQGSPAAKTPPTFLRGVVDHLAADTLYLRFADSLPAISIPVRLISELWISRGLSRGGSAVRFGVGYGVLGLVMGATVEPRGQHDHLSTGKAMLVGSIAGAATGMLLGTLFPLERWKRLRLETIVPSAQQLGAIISISW